MIKILMVCIVFAVGWYGNILYKNNELPFIQSHLESMSPSSSVSIDDKIKCTTKEGRVLYGKVPEGVVCAKHESVKASIVILPNVAKASNQSTIKTNNNVSDQFKCDGRMYCSQMTSKEEAEFFSHHCPNTKMDGDNDGNPCESDSRF